MCRSVKFVRKVHHLITKANQRATYEFSDHREKLDIRESFSRAVVP